MKMMAFRSANSTNLSIRRQLSQRVILLGVIAFLVLLALLTSALNASLSEVQANIDQQLNASDLAFTQFISSLGADLRSTGAALKETNDRELILKQMLERQPAIFELILIDLDGKVVLRRQRVGTSELGFMEQPWLETVKVGELYIGPVDYKEYGLPFVNIAIGVDDNNGDLIGTLLAETDFTSLWGLVTNIRVGQEGYAYIADGDGQVLAYRDINLVKDKTIMSNAIGIDTQNNPASRFIVGIEDEHVIASSLPLKGASSWYVVIEQPVFEALKPFFRLFVVLMLVLAAVIWQASDAIIFTQRRIVNPLGKLQEGTYELQRRNLDFRIDVGAKDELGVLAGNFNAMAAEISESINRLEERVSERTRDLDIAANVSRQITRELDLERLLPSLVQQTKMGFELYFVSVFLYNPQTEELLLEAGTGEEGERMKKDERSFHIKARPSLVAQCARERTSVIINATAESNIHFFNPLLPKTKAEAVFPMIVNDNLVGVLDLQSETIDRFQRSDTQIFSTLAEQIAIAVRNAQLYREQEHVAQELARTDLMKNQFLASMSHELRTPLNAIINFTQLIALGKAGPITQDQEFMLNTTLNSSRHLLQLINDVLDISKIQAGKLTLYVEDNVNLYDEINAVVEIFNTLLQRQNSLLEQSVQFVQNVDPNLPQISCDRRRFRQVLLNLLSNAVKFTEKGDITLSVKSGSKEVVFAVTDTGPGISQEMQVQIFEPFVQTMDGIKHAQGTGLGLPISRSLIHAHGGKLWVNSKIGEGSTFLFALPITCSVDSQ